jgi:hypothetical protein
VAGLVAAVFMQAGLYSQDCVLRDSCASAGDKLLDYGIGVLVVVACAVFVGRGWRGRLWGARTHTQAPS